MKTLILLILASILLSCNEKCEPIETEIAYKITVDEFELVDGGQISGYCGWIILAYDTTTHVVTTYKPAVVPNGIEQKLDGYTNGLFEVLPEQFSCVDARFEPPPDGSQKSTINFINILEWKE